MDEEPSEDREQREAADRAGAPGIPGLPGDDAATEARARSLAKEEEEIRRLVEAGADSPEALRELAARLREHRAREEALWRSEVKPALVKEGKGRIRGYTKRTSPVDDGEGDGSSTAWLWFLLAVLVVVVVLAASTTVWIVILPVLGLLVWAWKQGREGTS